MGRFTKIIGFSAPPAMVEEFEQLAQDEGRTKSELFREMLRLYRTYRKQMEQAQAARLDQLVERVLDEAQESSMTEGGDGRGGTGAYAVRGAQSQSAWD